jgi:hypothetical protein
MKLKCQQCGKEQKFSSHKEAFKEGWDFPPLCPVVACGDCPSAPLVIKDIDASKESVFMRGHLPPYNEKNS